MDITTEICRPAEHDQPARAAGEPWMRHRHASAIPDLSRSLGSWRAARARCAFGLALVSACASPLRQHVSSVRALAQVERLPALREGRVELDATSELRAMLREPLDADAAVRVALLNNRELRAQLRELGVVAAELTQAGLVANPVVELELLPERDSDLELRVEYDLTSLIMAPLGRRAQRHELAAARLEAAGAVVQLGYEVRTRFYALQAAQQQLGLAQQSLDALAASRDAARALLASGSISELDAASQIAAYERARIGVAELELELAARREQVQRQLGLHGEQTEWEIAAALEPVPAEPRASEDLERRTLEANFALRAAHQRLHALARRTGIARAEGWLPEVAADVHALRVKEQAGRSDEPWRWGGGVSVEVPLFDRGQARVRGVEAQFDALLERYQGQAVDLRSAAREAKNRLLSAHARARQYQDVIVPAQRTVMEQTLLQYNAMQLGVFQLLEARREQLDAELAYAASLGEYWSAVAEIEALMRGRAVRVGELRAPRQANAPAHQGGD